MRFVDRPLWLLLALVAAGLAALLVRASYVRRQRRLSRLGTAAAIARLAPEAASRPPRARAWRLGIAALALGAALAGPRWGSSTGSLELEGVDVALVVDLSLSMLAEDERPSRLERMKQEIRRLRASGGGDRVALIAFAGRSYILAPLTGDDGALELFLDNLDPSIVGVAGSRLAPALRQGVDLLLASRGDAERALVLMSDGEAFDDLDAATAVAREAREAGVHVVTVGFGTPGGGTIPVNGPDGRDVKRDGDGEIVVTRYDSRTLEAVAAAADGEFVPAEATDKGNRIRRSLATLEQTAREEAMRLSRPQRYQWFAALAFVLLLLDAWFADGGRGPRWLQADALRRWLPRRRPLRTGTAALLLLSLGLSQAQPLPAQGAGVSEALRLQRDGQAVDAIRAYRALIADGDERPLVLYNLGTALLAADSLNAAVEALERASYAADPDLRRNARYNLGLAYLRRGLLMEGETRSLAMEQARRQFRTVLLERPGDEDAQWNYELALRTPTDGGGGGGGAPPPQQQQHAPTPSDAMNRQQAEALLDAAAREERETQARRQRGNVPGRPPTGPDW